MERLIKKYSIKVITDSGVFNLIVKLSITMIHIVKDLKIVNDRVEFVILKNNPKMQISKTTFVTSCRHSDVL